MKFFSRKTINLLFLAVGLSALVLLIREVTLARLVDQLLAFGTVFLLVLLIEILSNIAASTGWYYAFIPRYKVRLSKLVLTNFASLAVAGALPTGQAGELAKGNLVRDEAPPAEIISSLLVYNYLHILTTSLVVAGLAAIPFWAGTFDYTVSLTVLIISILVLASTAFLGIFLRLGLLQKIFSWLEHQPLKILRPSQKSLQGAVTVDERLKYFASDYPGNLLKSVVWLIIDRLIQVAEVWIILYKLELPSSIPVVAMVFAATSLANYLLMVLPAREGFLEGSTYLIFGALGMNPADGFSMEIIRRIRKIFFQISGLVLLALIAKGKTSSMTKKLTEPETDYSTKTNFKA